MESDADKHLIEQNVAPKKRQLAPQVIAARWQPGQSGNPKGRPKKENTYSSVVREMLLAKSVTVTINRKPKTLHGSPLIVHGIAFSQITQALKGNVQAAKEIMDRAFGTVAQQVHQQIDLSGGCIVPKAIVSEPHNGAL